MEEKTNQNLALLISELKKKSITSKEMLWKRLALELERPSRHRRVVNLSKISRFSTEGDLVIVPGKVLASGTLDHKITIVAWTFSGSAREAIEEKKAKAITLNEFLKSDIKGKRVKIIG
jgi:large subunit ribosomal protein L18e